MHDEVPLPVLRAAEARALGGSWTAAAEAAGWDVHGLRRWVRQNPREWARELGRARRETRDAARDEAIAALRRQLRDAEPKTVQSAAATLGARFVTPVPLLRPNDAIDPMQTLEEMGNAFEAYRQAEVGAEEKPPP